MPGCGGVGTLGCHNKKWCLTFGGGGGEPSYLARKVNTRMSFGWCLRHLCTRLPNISPFLFFVSEKALVGSSGMMTHQCRILDESIVRLKGMMDCASGAKHLLSLSLSLSCARMSIESQGGG